MKKKLSRSAIHPTDISDLKKMTAKATFCQHILGFWCTFVMKNVTVTVKVAETVLSDIIVLLLRRLASAGSLSICVNLLALVNERYYQWLSFCQIACITYHSREATAWTTKCGGLTKTLF